MFCYESEGTEVPKPYLVRTWEYCSRNPYQGSSGGKPTNWSCVGRSGQLFLRWVLLAEEDLAETSGGGLSMVAQAATQTTSGHQGEQAE